MPKIVDFGEQKRRIANAAIEAIGVYGLDQVRLRDVAMIANVTTGAVTHYFDSKDALLIATLEEIVGRILNRQDKGRSGIQTLTIQSFIKGATTYLPLDPKGRAEWKVWLAFWGRAMTEPALRTLHQKYYSEIVERIAATLPALAAPNAQIPKQELQRAADSVIAAIDGVGIRATLEPELWSRQRQIETLRTMLDPILISFALGHSKPKQQKQKRKPETLTSNCKKEFK